MNSRKRVFIQIFTFLIMLCFSVVFGTLGLSTAFKVLAPTLFAYADNGTGTAQAGFTFAHNAVHTLKTGLHLADTTQTEDPDDSGTPAVANISQLTEKGNDITKWFLVALGIVVVLCAIAAVVLVCHKKQSRLQTVRTDTTPTTASNTTAPKIEVPQAEAEASHSIQSVAQANIFADMQTETYTSAQDATCMAMPTSSQESLCRMPSDIRVNQEVNAQSGTTYKAMNMPINTAVIYHDNDGFTEDANEADLLPKADYLDKIC